MLIQLTGSAETNINTDSKKKRTKQNETQNKANIEQNQANKKVNHY